MKVLDAQPAELVRWEVIDGPEEWIGTQIRFQLKQEDGFTIVLFGHEGWKEPVEFMYHCSTKWATFLMSLKKLVETGKGEPAPHNVKISNGGDYGLCRGGTPTGRGPSKSPLARRCGPYPRGSRRRQAPSRPRVRGPSAPLLVPGQ